MKCAKPWLCVDAADGEHLEGAYGLPDPDDEHLVAAAVVGGAGAIVTVNFRDLPVHMIPSQIQVKSPAEFAFETVELDPERGLRAVAQMAARRRRVPVLDVDDLLNIMADRYGMAAVADLIRGANAQR